MEKPTESDSGSTPTQKPTEPILSPQGLVPENPTGPALPEAGGESTATPADTKSEEQSSEVGKEGNPSESAPVLEPQFSEGEKAGFQEKFNCSLGSKGRCDAFCVGRRITCPARVKDGRNWACTFGLDLYFENKEEEERAQAKANAEIREREAAEKAEAEKAEKAARRKASAQKAAATRAAKKQAAQEKADQEKADREAAEQEAQARQAAEEAQERERMAEVRKAEEKKTSEEKPAEEKPPTEASVPPTAKKAAKKAAKKVAKKAPKKTAKKTPAKKAVKKAVKKAAKKAATASPIPEPTVDTPEEAPTPEATEKAPVAEAALPTPVEETQPQITPVVIPAAKEAPAPTVAEELPPQNTPAKNEGKVTIPNTGIKQLQSADEEDPQALQSLKIGILVLILAFAVTILGLWAYHKTKKEPVEPSPQPPQVEVDQQGEQDPILNPPIQIVEDREEQTPTPEEPVVTKREGKTSMLPSRPSQFFVVEAEILEVVKTETRTFLRVKMPEHLDEAPFIAVETSNKSILQDIEGIQTPTTATFTLCGITSTDLANHETARADAGTKFNLPTNLFFEIQEFQAGSNPLQWILDESPPTEETIEESTEETEPTPEP